MDTVIFDELVQEYLYSGIPSRVSFALEMVGEDSE